MGEYVTRSENAEIVKRLEDRIEKTEEAVENFGEIVRSVDKLALNMERMLQELSEQGQRLSAIEERDGELWRTLLKYGLTAIVGILIGYGMKKLGIN